MPDALLSQGSGALSWRATDFAKVAREALGHHLEGCFQARFPQEGTRQGRPDPQEFIASNTQELQESRVMRGSRRLPAMTPHPGEDAGMRVCIDVPGLNRAASQESLWPSRAGRCEDPPRSYVRMPFILPNTVAAHRPLLRSILEAQEVRHGTVLAEMEMALGDPPVPPEPPEVPGPGGS